MYGCPVSVHIYSDRSSNGTHYFWNIPSVSDNVDQSITPVQIMGPKSGSFFSELGLPYTIQYSATDSNGNQAQLCSFTVTVSRKFFL